MLQKLKSTANCWFQAKLLLTSKIASEIPVKKSLQAMWYFIARNSLIPLIK